MSKARSTGNLNNSIVISDTGAITFVSGSTTLMSISNTGAVSSSATTVSSSIDNLVVNNNAVLGSSESSTVSIPAFIASDLYPVADTYKLGSPANYWTRAYVQTGSFNEVNVTGKITAQTLVVQTITSSVDYVTGSTRFGSLAANTHTFTGSVLVSGSSVFSSSIADYGLSIMNVQDSSQGLLVRATDNDTSLYLLNLQSSVGATSQTWVDRFAITKNGNVGVGTNSPNYDLHINNSSIPRIQLTNTTTGATTGDGLHIYQSGNDSYILNKENAYLYLGTNNGVVVNITGSNVGIGIATPSNLLEVRSTSTTSETIANFQNAVNAVNRFNIIRIGQPSYAAYVGVCLDTYDTAYFSTNSNPTGALGIYYSTANRLGVNVRQPTNDLTLVASSTSTGKGIDFVNYAAPSQVIGQLTFEQVGDYLELKHKIAGGGIKLSTYDSPRVTITSGGNVGIGTATPVTLNGADVNLTIYGGQDCSLTLKDAVDTWEFYCNDDLYITTGSYNSAALTLLRSTGRVGVGTISPINPLHVNGAVAFSGTITNFGTGTDTYTQSTWYVDSSNQILFENGRTTNSAGGTGRTVYFTWRGGPGVGGGVQLQHGANAWAAYTSDARMKTKVADIENGVDAIMKLNPIKFKWTRELENSRTVTGFTAQNVEEAIPDAVFNSWQDEELGDVKSYYQDYLVPYLVKAIQEQQAQIDELKAIING